MNSSHKTLVFLDFDLQEYIIPQILILTTQAGGKCPRTPSNCAIRYTNFSIALSSLPESQCSPALSRSTVEQHHVPVERQGERRSSRVGSEPTYPGTLNLRQMPVGIGLESIPASAQISSSSERICLLSFEEFVFSIVHGMSNISHVTKRILTCLIQGEYLALTNSSQFRCTPNIL